MAGPRLTSTTRASIPNESRVVSIISAFFLISPRSASPPITSDKRDKGGYSQTTGDDPGIAGVIKLVAGETVIPLPSGEDLSVKSADFSAAAGFFSLSSLIFSIWFSVSQDRFLF